MGGKGGTSTDLQTTAGTNAYNAAAKGQTYAQIMASQPDYAAANKTGFDAYASKKAQDDALLAMLAGMGTSSAEASASAASLYAEQKAEAEAAAEEARIADLTGKRDAYIGSYFDAANSATAYVTEKIAGEESNAALMGVDYTMTDDLKNERISNYFGTLWSEGKQQELEGSFGEIGAGNFEQTIWRGEDVEAGPTGEVGEEKAGGGITARKNLMDEDDALGNTTALGA